MTCARIGRENAVCCLAQTRPLAPRVRAIWPGRVAGNLCGLEDVLVAKPFAREARILRNRYMQLIWELMRQSGVLESGSSSFVIVCARGFV